MGLLSLGTAMQPETILASQLLADMCAEIASARGKLGAFSEGLPELEVSEFLRQVGVRMERGSRVAILGFSGSVPKRIAGLHISDDPVQANQWRNDVEARNGTPLIVLALGPAPKLNSLRGVLTNVRSNDLRKRLIKLCKDSLRTTGRGLFLDAVFERTDEFSTSKILRYCAALKQLESQGKAALASREVALLALLGLLPSARLLGASSLAESRRALRANLLLRRSLLSLSSSARYGLVAMVERDDAFAARATKILRFCDTAEQSVLESLSAEDIEEVLRATPGGQSKTVTKQKVQRARIGGNELALDLLMANEGRGIKAAAERFSISVEPDEDGEIDADVVHVGSETVFPRLRSGTSQGASLFGKVVSADNFGGVITAPKHDDVLAAIRGVGLEDVTVEHFVPRAEEDVWGILRRAVDMALVPATALSAWDGYVSARSQLLERSCIPLIDHPLLALAGNERLRSLCEKLVSSYSKAMESVVATADALDKRGSDQAASRLRAAAARLDVVFMALANGWNAVLSPTHPFHLWRWLALSHVLSENRDDLQQIGEDALEAAVANPLGSMPPLVLSAFTPGIRIERTRAFVPNGVLGTLPTFAEPANLTGAGTRLPSLVKICERLIRLMPHAARGLRVALVDPPSVAAAVEDLLSVQSPLTERPVRLHIGIVRSRRPPLQTEEDDESLSFLARELRDGGGTLEIPQRVDGISAASRHVADFRPHLCVVFFPGQPERVSVGVARPPKLSPLMAPRVYEYDEFDDRFEVVVAGESDQFNGYHDIFCRSLGIPREDFVGSRSGASKSASELERLSLSSVWMTVVDENVEPTMRINGAQRIDWRVDGGRDVVTFTSHPGPTEALLDDALRVAGLVASEDHRKAMLRDLFELNGEAVLSLARATPGATLVNPRIGKAAIGVLAASRSYLARNPEALIISLDDPASRQWVLGVGSDDRHGDLIGIRSTHDGVCVDAIEVKAHDDPSGSVQVDGRKIRGRAAEQVEQTIAILKRILSREHGSPVIRARQDVLRDQLYRAVASRQYDRTRRARLDRILQDLFENGAADVVGSIYIVSIDATATSGATEAKSGTLPGGGAVTITYLVEGSGLKSRVAEMPPRPDRKGRLTNVGANNVFASLPVARVADEIKRIAPVVGVPSAGPAGTSTKAMPALAVSLGKSVTEEEVVWRPSGADNPLNNFGFLITGDSGNGKTSIIKAVIADAVAAGVPVCIFDFKNDYAKNPNSYADDLGIAVHDIERDGIPFNPMALVADDEGICRPINQVHELSGILARIFGLQAQQQARLRKAMVEAYVAVGIRPEQRVEVRNSPEAPAFSAVRLRLENDVKNETLLNRLSPLFDLDLFPDSATASTTFDGMLSKSIVLRLNALPDDKIKSAIAEFVIVRLHAHMLRGAQPRTLTRLLVLDEAWRVKDSMRLQELCREGRAFGVGVVIGTQFPGDIPEDLAGSLATQLMLGNSNAEHRKSVVRTLSGATSGPDAARLMQQLTLLQKFQGFFRNQQYAPYVLMTAVPYHDRVK